ncbi:hypothetical protein N9344_00575 [bacterium]|nr:hypothetical protein [bacterium]
MIKKQFLIFILLLLPFFMVAQFSLNNDIENVDYSNPKEFEIGGITVSGSKHFDERSVIALSGLAVGDMITVPGMKITKAIKNLWSQKLFGNIELKATKIQDGKIFFELAIEERPRLSNSSCASLYSGMFSKI